MVAVVGIVYSKQIDLRYRHIITCTKEVCLPGICLSVSLLAR